MRNIKLTVAYDGSEFCGWQVQPGQPTIQGTLSGVLERITQASIVLHGAGRTDAGVHAWGQVANFQTESDLPPEVFVRAANALLPASIRVRAAVEVALDFHARWSAAAKTYEYRIFRGTVAPPQLWRYVLHEPHALDFAAMAQAARLFEGEHDFTSFAASTGSEEEDRERTVVRTVYRSELLGPSRSPAGAPTRDRNETADDEWVYVIRGRSFLRNMVRKIAGTLLEIGRGRLVPADVTSILAQRDRTRSGPTAAPHGLSLIAVEYPGDVETQNRVAG